MCLAWRLDYRQQDIVGGSLHLELELGSHSVPGGQPLQKWGAGLANQGLLMDLLLEQSHVLLLFGVYFRESDRMSVLPLSQSFAEHLLSGHSDIQAALK